MGCALAAATSLHLNCLDAEPRTMPLKTGSRSSCATRRSRGQSPKDKQEQKRSRSHRPLLSHRQLVEHCGHFAIEIKDEVHHGQQAYIDQRIPEISAQPRAAAPQHPAQHRKEDDQQYWPYHVHHLVKFLVNFLIFFQHSLCWRCRRSFGAACSACTDFYRTRSSRARCILYWSRRSSACSSGCWLPGFSW